jgi:hypothetical protein
MSQRLKAGLSWPRFSVGALEPFEAAPRTCLPSSELTGTFSRLVAPSFQSRVVGVAHPANLAASVSVVPAWCLLSGLLRFAVAFAEK